MQVYLLLGQEDPLEEEMATHSQYSCLEKPWIEEPGELQSMGWQSRTRLSTLEKAMETHSSALAWKIPGMEEPGGLLFMGSHRVGHD